jgi:hypothetical protein
MSCKIGNLSSSLCVPKNFTTTSTFDGLTALTVDSTNIYYAQGGSKATVEMIGKDGRNRVILRNNTAGVTAMKIYHEGRLPPGKLS